MLQLQTEATQPKMVSMPMCQKGCLECRVHQKIERGDGVN